MGAVPSHPHPSVPLLLIDGHNLLWRATFGFPAAVHSRDKQRVLTGLFGFFALLRVAVRDEVTDPPEIIVVFDGEHGSDARRATDDTYKAQRPTDPAALAPLQHLPDVKRGLDATGIAWIEIDTAEADDVIATLAAGVPLDRRVHIMSSDRDFYQLITDTVTVLNTAMHPGKRHIGPADVHTRYGVFPHQWASYRALTGDPADNIPGVRGIGARTAAALLTDGITLDALPGTGRLTGRAAAVSAAWEQVLTWHAMITVRADISLPSKPSGTPSAPLPAPAAVLDRINAW